MNFKLKIQKCIAGILSGIVAMLMSCWAGGDVIVSEIRLDETEITLDVGEQHTLQAVVIPAFAVNSEVKWSSSDESVAGVNAYDHFCNIIAVGHGSATVKISSLDGNFSAVCEVTVLPMPVTVTTHQPVVLSATTVTLGGSISNAGSPAYTERGVCYGTSQNPTIDNAKAVASGAGEAGDFSVEVSGLTANVAYYARAYATTPFGTAYGNEVSFTPTERLPAVTTADANNTVNGKATLGGNIIDAGIPTYTECGVVYATTQDPTVADTKAVASGAGATGTFTVGVTGLTVGTTYYFRAYATNALGTVYGEERTFSTVAQAEVRFRKAQPWVYATQMGLWSQGGSLICYHNFGTSSGTSQYYSITPGNLVPQFYMDRNTVQYGAGWHTNYATTHNFQAGYRYTVALTASGDSFWLSVSSDGSY